MAVIWTLLTFITRYVTDTLYYNIWKGNRISFLGGQFHADPLTWSNWHLEILVFEEGENQRTRRKTLGAGRKTNDILGVNPWFHRHNLIVSSSQGR